MGYVRRRDEIATEKNAAAARRTIPEGSRTTFVVGAYSFGANFPVQPPNFPSQPVQELEQRDSSVLQHARFRVRASPRFSRV